MLAINNSYHYFTMIMAKIASNRAANLKVSVDSVCKFQARMAAELGRSSSDNNVRGFAPGEEPRLLIVDDQSVNRDVLAQQLRILGLHCLQADGGPAALRLLAEHSVDIVITDCSMPAMDGLELTRRLRAMEVAGRPRSIIIALTAYDLPGVAERCHQAGADDFLSKPLQLRQLAETLHRWHDKGVVAGARDSDADSAAAATATTPEMPPFDASVLAGILGSSDPIIMKPVMHAFMSSWQNSLSTIRQRLRERDAPALSEAAHAAKGLAEYGAAPRLAVNCARLETLARTHCWPDAAGVIEVMEQETGHLQRHLAELR